MVGVGALTEQPNDQSSQTDTETKPGKLKQGDPGYYEEGQYSPNPDKVFRACKDAWQSLLGHGAVVKKPFGRGWDWFEQAIEESSADTLIPAFELWAHERGKFNPSPNVIGDFLRDGWADWVSKVIPLNTFDSTDAIVTDDMREQWRVEANANCAANIDWYRAKLKESEGDYEANAQLFDEETQKQMREEIERYREEIAKLEEENS